VRYEASADAQQFYYELCEDALRSTILPLIPQDSFPTSLLQGLEMQTIGMGLPIASFFTGRACSTV